MQLLLPTEYTDHTSRSVQPEDNDSDVDDNIAESDASAASESEDNEIGNNGELSDADESGDEGVVSVRTEYASEGPHTSSSSPSNRVQPDFVPPPPITPSENCIAEPSINIEIPANDALTPSTCGSGSKEPAQIGSEGRSMRIRKARVLISSCDCGREVEDGDRYEDSQVAVQCAVKGCETIWVCLLVHISLSHAER